MSSQTSRPDPETLAVDHRRLRPGLEIALLVEDLVVGQLGLAMDRGDGAAARSGPRSCRFPRGCIRETRDDAGVLDFLRARARGPPRSGGGSRGETAGPPADSPRGSARETGPGRRRDRCAARRAVSMTRVALPCTSPTSRLSCARAIFKESLMSALTGRAPNAAAAARPDCGRAIGFHDSTALAAPWRRLLRRRSSVCPAAPRRLARRGLLRRLAPALRSWCA